MIRVVIVDDERPALDELAYIVQKCKGTELIGAFTDPVEALQCIRMREPDLVFLDVDMPSMTGMEVADVLNNEGLDIAIVFATAYEEYALDAFDKNAADYVLKPYEEERILKAVRKMRIQRENEIKYERLLHNQTATTVQKPIAKLPISVDEKIVFITPEDILFADVVEGDVFIHTTEKTYLYPDTLTQLEAKLSGQIFFRTHRGYIVNLKRVTEVSPYFNHTLLLHVEGSDEDIPVSRSNVKAFKERLGI